MIESYEEILISFRFRFNNVHEVVYAKDMKTMEIFLRQHNFLKEDQSIEEFIRLNLFMYNKTSEWISSLGYAERDTEDKMDNPRYQRYDVSYPEKVEGRILKQFKFKSNNSNDNFIIISNDYLVINAIELVCNELTPTLIFGNIVVKNDIEFIKLICELIDTLPKVNVLDYFMMDCDETNDSDAYEDYTGKDKSLNEKKREEFEKVMRLTPNTFMLSALDEIPQGRFHDSGCHYIYKSFMEDCFIELIQPITIEAYVSNFSKSLK